MSANLVVISKLDALSLPWHYTPFAAKCARSPAFARLVRTQEATHEATPNVIALSRLRVQVQIHPELSHASAARASWVAVVPWSQETLLSLPHVHSLAMTNAAC
ncbi:hypothetical protein CPAR01_10807 [Colletotrichum paranaense]|uniref:Uncharacterized protein n=2 Tax=Colletotrichum acutatum species complex TaxID=2707335 RepID=A0AAI9Y509_9PEZI|nr:uncharacterized protein CPAR01_10807 [Colletotrichum paranaense]KAK1471469.1 hypothetical protein CCUS01_05951 [Colletotrichum cuscutae]KAK1531158.1 hypothetical protein CPAR01_10807 [Colletotrichum paranaense]